MSKSVEPTTIRATGAPICQAGLVAIVTEKSGIDLSNYLKFFIPNPRRVNIQNKRLLSFTPTQSAVLHAVARCTDVMFHIANITTETKTFLQDVYAINTDDLNMWFKNRINFKQLSANLQVDPAQEAAPGGEGEAEAAIVQDPGSAFALDLGAVPSQQAFALDLGTGPSQAAVDLGVVGPRATHGMDQSTQVFILAWNSVIASMAAETTRRAAEATETARRAAEAAETARRVAEVVETARRAAESVETARRAAEAVRNAQHVLFGRLLDAAVANAETRDVVSAMAGLDDGDLATVLHAAGILWHMANKTS